MDVLKKLKRMGKPSDVGRNQNSDIYQFSKLLGRGFPNRPSALAFDHKISLLAVGTESGAVSIYGRPGVQFSTDDQTRAGVKYLFFLPEQGRLVALRADNSVDLWKLEHVSYRGSDTPAPASDDPQDPYNNQWVGVTTMVRVMTVMLEIGEGRTVTSCCLTSDALQLLLGTNHGSVLTVNITDLQLTERVLQSETLLQSALQSVKASEKFEVVSIVEHPTAAGQFLIGFQGGYIVLWNHVDGGIVQAYNVSVPVEGVTFGKNGEEFVVAHSDGSYTIWSTSDSSSAVESATTPYGPFPCEAIRKIDWQLNDRKSLMVFTGGMPTANYKDRHTVTVIENEKHIVFDLSSKVIDYIVLRTASEDKPNELVILSEKELVAIDLSADDWPVLRLPYLCTIGSSAVQAVHLEENVPLPLWERLVTAGKVSSVNLSARDWPVTGGMFDAEQDGRRDLLLTGHTDGTLCFWNLNSIGPLLLHKVLPEHLFSSGSTSDVGGKDDKNDGAVDWPPFRKIGSYEDTTGDGRIGIQKIAFCTLSHTLVLSSNSGQILVLKLNETPLPTSNSPAIRTVTVDIVKEEDLFEWTGVEPVVPRGNRTTDKAFHPVYSGQLNPPSACTTLSLHSGWKLLAVASVYGHALIDYSRGTTVFMRCTLLAPDGLLSPRIVRNRSLKTSLRESFRNLRVRPRVTRSFDIPHDGVEQKTKKKKVPTATLR